MACDWLNRRQYKTYQSKNEEEYDYDLEEPDLFQQYGSVYVQLPHFIDEYEDNNNDERCQ